MQETIELTEEMILDEHVLVLEGKLWVAHSIASLTAEIPATCPNCGMPLDDEAEAPALYDEAEAPALYDTLLGALGAVTAPGRRVPILVAAE